MHFSLRVIFYFVAAAVSKGKNKDMPDNEDQNNLSLDSDEEGDGSDGEHDEPELINNKGWFKLGGEEGITEVLSLSQAT